MCGFVGIQHFDGTRADAQRLSELAAVIEHRGPDGHGTWAESGFGVAHRRLAIIDPDGSPQPMSSVDGALHVAFNGEILNYRELRSGLDYPFRTDGDTEVLLAAHREFGMAAPERLRGQFAYVIHDSIGSQTWLVRDRLGIAPLYYVQRPGWVAFASEAKALLPLIPDLTVDEESLDAYLARRFVPAPHTLLAGVRKLPPAHVAHIGSDGTLTLHRYWTPGDDLTEVDDAEAVSLISDALDASVQDNLVADVPVGAYLSGGLDSSLVAALASKHVEPGTMHTFSAGFGDTRADELPFARQVSSALGTIHHEVEVRASDFQDHWHSLTWHRDAPLSEPADVAVFQLASKASEHVKVVLSGEGADEVFAGYPKHRMARVSALQRPAFVGSGLDQMQRRLPQKLARARIAVRALSADTPEERLVAWFAPFTRSERIALLGRQIPMRGPQIPDSGLGALRRMLTADCGPWLADNLLERGDRMTMAASVELRPPFLDHRLVELGLSLPDRLKIRRGSTKWVERQVARSLLPAEILERPKVGFRVPLDRWFREGLRSYAWDVLTDRDSFVAQVFDRDEVELLLTRHDRGRSDESNRIWTLLSLEVWHQATFNRRRPEMSGQSR